MNTTEQGFAALQSGDAYRAWLLFQKAVGEEPGSARAWEGLGLSLCGVGRPADALTALDRAVSLAPGQAALHRHRGAVLEQLQRPAEALAAYRQVLALQPGDAACLAAVQRLQFAAVPPPVYAAYPVAYPAPPRVDNSEKQVLIVVGSVLLAVVIGVAGLSFTAWRIGQRLTRSSKPAVTQPLPAAPSWRTGTRPEVTIPRYRPPRTEFRFPERRVYPRIQVPGPPTIRIPEIRQPEVRIIEPPPVYIPAPPRIVMPEPPRIRRPEIPRFEPPELPRRFYRPELPRPPFPGSDPADPFPRPEAPFPGGATPAPSQPPASPPTEQL